MIVSLCRTCRRLPESLRFGRRIPIVRRSFNVAAPRPESRAAHFVRIRFARDRIRSRTLRRPPSRKSRGRQIEAAPEKMHGTGFPDEARAKFDKNLLAARQNPPKTIRVFGIVGSVLR